MTPPVPRVRTSDLEAPRRAASILRAAFLFAIITRLGFMLLPRVPLETKAVATVGDSREYIALARNLVINHTFTRDTLPPLRPELFRTPAYPLLLAVPFIVHRSSFIVLALALQLLLSLVTVWLTWKLGLELKLAPTTAAFAALLVGLSPNLAFLSSKLISEALFTPLLLICVLLLSRYRLSGSAAEVVAAGVCAGLLILTRPIATFFPLLLALYVLWRAAGKTGTVPRRSFLRCPGHVGRRRTEGLSPVFQGIGNSLLLLAAAAVVVAPWVIRNGRKTGRYIVSTASEHNVYLYDAATVLASEKGITIPRARDLMMAEAEKEFGPIDTANEATMWQRLSTVARRRLFERPALAIPVWLFGVAADFLNPISVGPLLIHSGSSPAAGSANLLQSSLALLVKGKVKQAFTTAWRVRVGGAPRFILVVLGLATVFNLILIWFGLAGLLLRRTRGMFWLLLPILYFTLVTGTVGDARFRAPIEPLLCLLAAAVLIRPPRLAPVRPPELSSDAVSESTHGSCSIGLSAPRTSHHAYPGVPVISSLTGHCAWSLVTGRRQRRPQCLHGLLVQPSPPRRFHQPSRHHPIHRHEPRRSPLKRPKEAPVYNAAFDVTPPRLITGFVTDRGIIRPPFRNTIRRLLAR